MKRTDPMFAELEKGLEKYPDDTRRRAIENARWLLCDSPRATLFSVSGWTQEKTGVRLLLQAKVGPISNLLLIRTKEFGLKLEASDEIERSLREPKCAQQVADLSARCGDQMPTPSSGTTIRIGLITPKSTRDDVKCRDNLLAFVDLCTCGKASAGATRRRRSGTPHGGTQPSNTTTTGDDGEYVTTLPVDVPDEDEMLMTASEGRRLELKHHLGRERCVALRNAKVKAVLSQKGSLACEVCGFDFAVVFGELGVGYCEVHHLVPLGERNHEKHTNLSELAVVCPNCHRMLHRKSPPLRPHELRDRRRVL